MNHITISKGPQNNAEAPTSPGAPRSITLGESVSPRLHLHIAILDRIWGEGVPYPYSFARNYSSALQQKRATENLAFSEYTHTRFYYLSPYLTFFRQIKQSLKIKKDLVK